MASVYTDNQPDFAWLLPGETKRFQQYWYPVHAIGPARQATLEAAVAVSAEADAVRIGVITTASRPGARVRVETGDAEIAEYPADLGPERPWTLTVAHGDVAAVPRWEEHTSELQSL